MGYGRRLALPPLWSTSLRRTLPLLWRAPDPRDSLAKHGGDPMSMTQAEFARFVLSESESAARIIKAAAINP